ncbi:hypothetical protein BCU68_00510 [Vibrio sp. 10N.286.49.B3]|uniref:PcfJ domain-containing protein n=1 Tax=Vibrio sp. 10N.286.49.B3 TaxID=1880855 RepID=UPI000C81C409|nr:PcfJ domain-containing protein [Vibrio sp. 10N.286.49.B3]PMH46565.1 hypothetical protein BCU68_00510 [Vibrio sp. 10N.286.49.B3]
MQALLNKPVRSASSLLVTIPTTSIGYRYDVQISPWNEGFSAFRRYENGRLELIEGGVGVGLNFIQDDADKEQWLSTIPDGFLSKTGLLPEHQYQMLWLAANSDKAKDILAVRPLILALICERYPVDNSKALSVAELGQRQILDHLGFASTKAVLRFIDKLDLTYHRTSEIIYVMKMLDARTGYFKRFSHYSKVNFASLSLDHTHPFLTGTHLGRAIGQISYTTRLKITLCIEDTLRLGQALGVQAPMENIVNLTDYQSLVELHDEWVRRRNDMRIESTKPTDADIPYTKHLHETASISQIVDYQELCKEGKDMLHCIAVYHNRIAQGRYAAFKLTHPERMTVGVTINDNNKFPYTIEQIYGLRNKVPSHETRTKVYEWLEQARNNKKLSRKIS